jgi:hypothetical protein
LQLNVQKKIFLHDKSELQFFDNVPVGINFYYGFLFCTICGYQLTAAWEAHLYRNHKILVTPDFVAQIAVEMKGLTVRDCTDAPIQGLIIYHGVKCSSCSFLSQTEDGIKKHHYQSHHGSPNWTKCVFQQFHLNSPRFEVFFYF